MTSILSGLVAALTLTVPAAVAAPASAVGPGSAVAVPPAATIGAVPADFHSSFEPADLQPDWTNTSEVGPDGRKRTSGVTGTPMTGIPRQRHRPDRGDRGQRREPATTAARAAPASPNDERASMGRDVYSVRLPRSHYDRLVLVAERDGSNVTELVRVVVEDLLRERAEWSEELRPDGNPARSSRRYPVTR